MAAESVKVDPQLLPIAGGQVTFTANYVGFGIVSVVSDSTGKYLVTLEQDHGAAPIVLVSAFGGSADEIISYDPDVGTNQIMVTIADVNGTLKSSAFSIMVYASADGSSEAKVSSESMVDGG